MKFIVDSAVLYYGDFNLEGTKLDTLLDIIKSKELGLAKDSIKFEAKPNIRDIEYAGRMERSVVGKQRITKWDVTVEGNILDLNEAVLNASLVNKKVSESTKYDVFEPSYGLIAAENYKDLLIVGTELGTEDPIAIHVFNSLNPEGLLLELKDVDEASTAMKFTGAYNSDGKTTPFKIYKPKTV